MNHVGMRDKIVVAIDGSTTARNAAEVAIRIAAANALLIEGFYIVDEHLILDPYANHSKELGSDPGLVSRDSLIDKFEQKGFSVLDQLEKSCVSKGVSFTTNLLLGGVPELILENAKQASLLALGRRGNSHAAQKDHLGGHFRRIAHHTDKPLIVGGDYVQPIRRIFLMYDISERDSQVTEWAFRLQQAFSAKLIVGWMGENKLRSESETLDSQFSSKGIEIEEVLDLRSKSMDEFMSAITAAQTDLLIMGGYHHPEIVALLVGSPVEEILREYPMPILIV